MTEINPASWWAGIVGQSKAVTQLQAAVPRPVHAYLFVGPAGAGKQQAAHAFAAALLNDVRALQNTHPDVITVEREGASVNVAQAREISRIAARSPLEGDRKIIILTEFHLVSEAAPALLKTIEEASETTIFIVLAESVTRELVTVASRCVRIDFAALSQDVIKDALIAEGIGAERAVDAAAGAMGSLDRARLLAADDGVVARRALWKSVFNKLDGTGSAAAEVALEIIAAIDLASSPLLVRQADEVSDLEARIKDGTAPNSLLKALETKHKREQRRLRTDELRAGFADLAHELPSRGAVASNSAAMTRVTEAMSALQWANEALEFNPNEALLVQSLFVKLSHVNSAALV